MDALVRLRHEARRRPHRAEGTCSTHGCTPFDVEAPDRGDQELGQEAPEQGRGRLAEAADAGEGRMTALEQEFTHGRSQS